MASRCIWNYFGFNAGPSMHGAEGIILSGHRNKGTTRAGQGKGMGPLGVKVLPPAWPCPKRCIFCRGKPFSHFKVVRKKNNMTHSHALLKTFQCSIDPENVSWRVADDDPGGMIAFTLSEFYWLKGCPERTQQDGALQRSTSILCTVILSSNFFFFFGGGKHFFLAFLKKRVRRLSINLYRNRCHFHVQCENWNGTGRKRLSFDVTSAASCLNSF